MAQQLEFTLVGEGRIEPGELFERDSNSAQRHGEARLTVGGGQAQRRANGPEAGEESVDANPVKQHDRDGVLRKNKRLADRNVAGVGAVGVGGPVAGKIDRLVGNDRVGVNDELLESHGEDERLQGRSRRTDGTHEIDIAVAALRTRFARPDIADNRAILVADDDDGDVDAAIPTAQRVASNVLGFGLEIAVEQGADRIIAIGSRYLL